VGITAGSREVTGRNACDRRHSYLIIIIIIIMVQGAATKTAKFGDDLLENDIDYLGYLTALFYSHKVCGVE